MNEDQEHFEALRRLLALKRHEVPPPGYFNDFSRQVIARIRAGELEEPTSLADRFGMARLLEWLQGLETKPVFAGGFAASLCLLLLFGAVMAQRPEITAQAMLQPIPRESAPLPMVAVTVPTAPVAFQQPTGQITVDENSTNPVINFQNPSLAVDQPPFGPQSVNYSLPGN